MGGVMPYRNMSASSSSSVTDDMKGLVLALTVVDADANFDRDSGVWIQLVCPKHAGAFLCRYCTYEV
jgi:hypothetical protein